MIIPLIPIFVVLLVVSGCLQTKSNVNANDNVNDIKKELDRLAIGRMLSSADSYVGEEVRLFGRFKTPNKLVGVAESEYVILAPNCLEGNNFIEGNDYYVEGIFASMLTGPIGGDKTEGYAIFCGDF